MAKKGGSPHYLRIRSPSNLPIAGKKEEMWLLSSAPGPHAKNSSISLGVLMRDILKVAASVRECKKILGAKQVLVNGIAQKETKLPIGLMDVISLPAAGKYYRMGIRAFRLQPVEITPEEAKKQFLKVVKKHTIAGGKVCITFHNGRNLIADNDLKVGDTVIFQDKKILKVLKFKSGARCLVVSGKHAGDIAQFESLIERTGSMDAEARLKGANSEFVTVAKYLFAVDETFN